jgi:hypothetical protein
MMKPQNPYLAIDRQIIGDLPGQRHPEQIVMLGSHYDGHDISQGAGDPASGAVSVLEAARVLATYAPAPACTVRFVLWGVEEIGLLGSREYVKTHEIELSDIRFYLNVDSAGTRSNTRDIVLNEWAELEACSGKSQAGRFVTFPAIRFVEQLENFHAVVKLSHAKIPLV